MSIAKLESMEGTTSGESRLLYVDVQMPYELIFNAKSKLRPQLTSTDRSGFQGSLTKPEPEPEPEPDKTLARGTESPGLRLVGGLSAGSAATKLEVWVASVNEAVALNQCPPWLREANALERQGLRAQAIDRVMESVDADLRQGDFEVVDRLLDITAPDWLPTPLLLAALSITLSARDHLPSRAEFLRRAEKTLLARGESADDLLQGL